MRLILLLIFSTLLGCDSGSKHKATASKGDTVYTLKTFVDFPRTGLRGDYVLRVVKDTFTDVMQKDGVTLKRKPIQDTIYLLPILDSTKTKVAAWMYAIKGSVWEGDDAKKGFEVLNKWVADHKQQYWPDTTKPKAK